MVKLSAVALLAVASSASAFTVGSRRHQQSRTTKLNVEPNLLADTAAAAGIPVDSLPVVIGGAVAAAGTAIAGTFAALNKGASGATQAAVVVEEEPEVKIDVSIPYDAAAQLAFSQLEGKDLDFAKFKPLWEEVQVAEVVLKKQQRVVSEAEADVQKKMKALEAAGF